MIASNIKTVCSSNTNDEANINLLHEYLGTHN